LRRRFLHPTGFTLGDSSAGWFGINGGIAYLRNARAAGGAATLWYELERAPGIRANPQLEFTLIWPLQDIAITNIVWYILQ